MDISYPEMKSLSFPLLLMPQEMDPSNPEVWTLVYQNLTLLMQTMVPQVNPFLTPHHHSPKISLEWILNSRPTDS